MGPRNPGNAGLQFLVIFHHLWLYKVLQGNSHVSDSRLAGKVVWRSGRRGEGGGVVNSAYFLVHFSIQGIANCISIGLLSVSASVQFAYRARARKQSRNAILYCR
jgi:hypothetical protein